MTMELFPLSAVMRDARVSARPRTAEGVPLLSLGHIPSSESSERNSSHPDKQTDTKARKEPDHNARIWIGASRAECPGIPNLNRNPSDSAVTGKRRVKGICCGLSEQSRRNLHKKLSTIKADAVSYTMAFTLPADFESILPAEVHRLFCDVLCSRFKAAPQFANIGFGWKQELQERGALHYHSLIFGIDGEEAKKRVWSWLADQWTRLVCANSSETDREHHRWWHADRPEAFQLVDNFAGYFAKYVGKNEDAPGSIEGVPGRWWGFVNRPAIPFVEATELPLPTRAAVLTRRAMAKLRQVRANNAKFNMICRKCGLWDKYKRKPTFSQLEVQQFLEGRSGENIRQFFIDIAAKHGLRWGKYKFKGFARYGRVCLLGRNAPDIAIRILRYVRERLQNEHPNIKANETPDESRT